MFRVLVVDDEPAAVQHICSIIKIKCPDFMVAGTAGNGRECLEWIKNNQADLVITDVRMPVMNGIETVTSLRQEFPEMMSVIVSGYQEFEYAQGAIKAGASDYILKPVVPEDMRKTLEKIADRLKQKYYYKKNSIIHNLCNGEIQDEKETEKYFPYSSYYAAIIRRNGLPKRFSGSSGLEIYSDIYEKITIYGRDEMEELYLIPEDLLMGQKMEKYIQMAGEKYSKENEYLTMVYRGKSFAPLKIQEVIQELYRKLDMLSVVGVSQTINIDLCSDKTELSLNQGMIHSMLGNMDYLIREQQYDKVGKELKRLYQKWHEEKRPQIFLEYISRQILYLIANNTKIGISMIECEYMMEDAFYYATSTDELIENLFEIMLKHLKVSEEFQKVDSPEFLQTIKKYLAEYMADAITLQSVCKKFAISQTYLSKLFRKYEKQSFNQYLTDIRMKKAIGIMKENANIFVKDVAAMVGYNDQFYFSRIFRSYTGKSPTEYGEEFL